MFFINKQNLKKLNKQNHNKFQEG